MSYNGFQLETPTPSALTLGGDLLNQPALEVSQTMSHSTRSFLLDPVFCVHATITVPVEVLLDKRLCFQDVRVLMAICAIGGHSCSLVAIHMQDLCDATGYSPEAVRDALARLIGFEWIVLSRAPGDKTVRFTFTRPCTYIAGEEGLGHA
jgi:hypothetical protein